MRKKTYPFNAIIGQHNMKKALILNIINPNIGGVLISGEKGTGKSTMVRGLANLVQDIDFINLPLNITEDRLIGSINIEKAISSSSREIEYGIFKKAHGNILYIDEVNLLSKYISNLILDVNSSKINIIERDGISSSHESNFILVGSMNPEEGLLSSQFLDRFGLFVEAKAEKNISARVDIMKNRISFERDRQKFISSCSKKDEEVRCSIARAKSILKDVSIDENLIKKISEIVVAGRCQGHRAELVMLETAKAICALDERRDISFADIEEAAKYALPHRIRENINIDEYDEEQNMQGRDENDKENETPDLEKEERPNQEKIAFDDMKSALEETKDIEDIENMTNSANDEESDIGKTDDKLKIKANFSMCKSNSGNGKRSKVRVSSKKGRYIRYRSSQGDIKDIAIDATLRSAAINQANRCKNNHVLRLDVRKEDIKEKIREARTGATILFVVDASGSMGAKKRMVAVKGAVLSLLNDAYQKRDNVGIIAFRKNKAEVILNITRSVDLAEKSLKGIKTGGKTPLAYGLERAHEILKVEKIKNENSLQYMVLVTDGKANVALNSSNCYDEIKNLANKIRLEGIKSMVLDTEKGMIEFGFAKEIAKDLDAEYVKLDKCTKEEVKSNIRDLMI